MSWVWDQSLPSNAKIVLLAIADHAGDDGRDAWPSIARLARMTGYSTRQVQRIIGELVRHEVLAIEHPGGFVEGRNRTPRYRVVMRAPVVIDRGEFTTGGATPELRREVIEAFDRECYWCHEKGSEDDGPDAHPWEVDRLVSTRQGGRYEMENVVLSCRTCNRARGDKMTPPHGATPVTPGGRHPDADGATPVTPEPSLDPSGNQDPSAPEGAGEDPERGFEVWWERYPKRNGKRIGKAKCRTKWRAFSLATKHRVYAATVHYAAAVEAGSTIAKDPERFLAGRYWEDWVDGPGEAAQEAAPASPVDGTAKAARNLEERTRRIQAGEACPLCQDVGIVVGEDDLARPCSCRKAS